MYNIENIDFMKRACDEWCGGISGLYEKKMLELGNQEVWEHARARAGVPYETAKAWFQDLSVDHVSIDLNGKDGALEMDLSHPLDLDGVGEFDVVTNIGTSEHVLTVNGQRECFANIHRYCRVGGLMVHTLPPVGQWKGHCATLYTPKFLETLASANGYKVLLSERINLTTLNKNVDLLCVALVKQSDKPFKAWDDLKGEIVYDEDNDEALNAGG